MEGARVSGRKGGWPMWRRTACVDCPVGEVQFNATDAATASIMLPELQAFSKVLPPRVKLKVYGLPADVEDTASRF